MKKVIPRKKKMPQVFGKLGGDCFAAFLSHTSLILRGVKIWVREKITHSPTHYENTQLLQNQFSIVFQTHLFVGSNIVW